MRYHEDRPPLYDPAFDAILHDGVGSVSIDSA